MTGIVTVRAAGRECHHSASRPTVGASLSAKVETASITSNVKGFGEQLAGDEYLKSREFPEATFVSTAFRQISRAAARSMASSR